jgi:hypothetical protein
MFIVSVILLLRLILVVSDYFSTFVILGNFVNFAQYGVQEFLLLDFALKDKLLSFKVCR